MPLHDLTEFLKLSSALNYNLSAASLNRYNVLIFILGEKRLHSDDETDLNQKAIVMEALSYLFGVYRQKRRRLGPIAVLHPLRAAALYVRAQEKINLLDLLSILFHDILEDINPVDFKLQEWKTLEQQLVNLLKRTDQQEENLISRLTCITRHQDESYNQYLWRLFECLPEASNLVQVKLADRLDNTLDMRITLQDPMEGIDFFQMVFQILFVSTYRGHKPNILHPPTEPLNGAKRLYQLFKNAVLLTLIRQKGVLAAANTSQILFNAVAEASLKEAQRTFIHVIDYHYRDIKDQRELLLETMEYCFSGRSDLVTKPDSNQILDGLFASYFGHNSSKLRNQKLDILYQDKPLMLQAAIAFIVIFMNFLNDSSFYVRGISNKGIDPA